MTNTKQDRFEEKAIDIIKNSKTPDEMHRRISQALREESKPKVSREELLNYLEIDVDDKVNRRSEKWVSGYLAAVSVIKDFLYSKDEQEGDEG